MRNNYSRHARARAQQRGIPRLVHTWLLDYGEERYDGRGGVIRYFNRVLTFGHGSRLWVATQN